MEIKVLSGLKRFDSSKSWKMKTLDLFIYMSVLCECGVQDF